MKNERQQRLLFIIPAVIIAIILIICIAVAVGSKSGNKGNKKDSRSVSVTENEQDIVAESEMLELVKEDALKESNVEDKDNKQNDGTQSDTNDNSVAADSNSDNANTASDKSSEDKTAAGQKTSTDGNKTSTGSNKTSTGSNNTQKLAGNDSKPEASNQTAAPEPAQSEPAQPETPKNEYVAPGWIFYGSKAGNGMSGEQKAYIDSLVKQWTDGSISDSYLAEQIAHKMNEEWGLSLNSVGISGDDRCIYPSKNEIPNYNEALAEAYGFYNFTGLYTKGEHDEYGYLICYMWGVGIF